MIRAEYPVNVHGQRLEVGHRGRRTVHVATPAAEVVAGDQGMSVVGTEQAYTIVEQRGVGGDGACRVAGVPTPFGDTLPGGERVRMVRAEHA